MSIGPLLPVTASFCLNALVIYFALKGPRPRYPQVILYCLIQILVMCADMAFLSFVTRSQYIDLYWAGDLLAHFFILLLILGLIGRAIAGQEKNRKIVWGLAAGVFMFALVSAYVFYSPHVNRWITPLSRNMSFCEEVLNFVLWGAIVQKREQDYLLLMVTAGIGVQVTGEVIGHTLRLYSHDPSTVWVPTELVYLSEVLCLAIWIWAFYSARSTTKRAPPPDPTPHGLVNGGASRGSTMGA